MLTIISLVHSLRTIKHFLYEMDPMFSKFHLLILISTFFFDRRTIDESDKEIIEMKLRLSENCYSLTLLLSLNRSKIIILYAGKKTNGR